VILPLHARELPAKVFRFSAKHPASKHYLSSDLSAFSFGLGLQAFQASAMLPSFGGYSYAT